MTHPHPPLSPSPFPLRGQGMCQPPYSVLKPLRYKVGGPSEVFASSRAAFCGMRPHGHELLTSCRKAKKPIAARPDAQKPIAARPDTLKPIAARPEGAEAPSPGQRPGYNGNRQGALNQRSPAHSGKVKGKSFKIHLTQLSQIGKFKKLKPYALQLNIQTIRLLS